MFKLNPQSYEDLLSLYNEETIYNYYLGHCNLNHHFLSVLPGRKENTASMILRSKGEAIHWFDFGKTKNQVCGSRAIHLVMELHRDPDTKELKLGYWAALDKMYDDLAEGKPQVINVERKETELFKQIRFQEFRPQCIDNYYGSYHITPSTLYLFNVWHCTEFRFNNKLWHKSTPEDFMAIYMFSIENHAWQICRPYADISSGKIDKKKKFRPNNMKDVIMGIHMLPKFSNVVAITKAYKEVLLAYECKVPSVSKVGERIIMEPYEIESLKQRCNHLIYIGDNDDTGRSMQEEYKKIGLDCYEVKGSEKDTTDLSKEKGLLEAQKFYHQILKNYG